MILSDETMQELLRIELLQKVLHKPIAYQLIKRHPKNRVKLDPKPESELLLCLEKLRHHAEEVSHNSPHDIVEAAKRARSEEASVDELIAFGKLFYQFLLEEQQSHLSSHSL